MVSIQLGKLLSLSVRGQEKQSLIERFFAAKKPVAKYFCNRHLAKKVMDDVVAGFAARDEIHKSHGGIVTPAGTWQVPPDQAEACQAEVAELHGKVLEYPDAIKVKASDMGEIKDAEGFARPFEATESEMEALSDFLE